MASEEASFEQLANAVEHFNRANVYEESDRFEEALDECDSTIAIAKSFLAEVFNLRGIVLEELDRSADAMEAYRNALRLDPESPEVKENLLALESELGISHELVTIAAFSFPAEAHVLRAKLEEEGVWAFVADESMVAANWLYSNAVGGVKLQVREHEVEKALEILGMEPEGVEDTEDDLDEAEQDEYTRCPNCNSGSIRYEEYAKRGVFASHLLLGFPLPFLKRKWHCQECGHEWKARQLTGVERLYHLAEAQADEGRWDEAVRLYKEALALEPSDSDLHNNLGTVYEEAGRLEEAEEAYRQASTLSPEDSMPYYNLGTLYEGQGRMSEAIEAFQKCLQYSTDPEERVDVEEKLNRLVTRRGR
jgi:Flp pilus assembly protein TadD